MLNGTPLVSISLMETGRTLKEDCDFYMRLDDFEKKILLKKDGEWNSAYSQIRHLIIERYRPYLGSLEAYIYKVVNGTKKAQKKNVPLEEVYGVERSPLDIEAMITERLSAPLPEKAAVDLALKDIGAFLGLMRQLQIGDSTRTKNAAFMGAFFKTLEDLGGDRGLLLDGLKQVEAEYGGAMRVFNWEERFWDEAKDVDVLPESAEFEPDKGLDSMIWGLADSLKMPLYKVNYVEFEDFINDKLDENGCNELKLVIGGDCLYRTLTGMKMHASQDMKTRKKSGVKYAVSEIILDEFKQTVNLYLGGYLVYVGEENLYFLTGKRVTDKICKIGSSEYKLQFILADREEKIH